MRRAGPASVGGTARGDAGRTWFFPPLRQGNAIVHADRRIIFHAADNHAGEMPLFPRPRRGSMTDFLEWSCRGYIIWRRPDPLFPFQRVAIGACGRSRACFEAFTHCGRACPLRVFRPGSCGLRNFRSAFGHENNKSLRTFRSGRPSGVWVVCC